MLAAYIVRSVKKKNAKKQQACEHREAAGRSSKLAVEGTEEPTTQEKTNDVVEPAKSPSGEVAAPADPIPLGPCDTCKADKHRARVYRWKLIAGLFLPYTINSLDLTITATALPFIASHFGKLDQLNWIVTAYTLTSTSFIPAFGQLADVFGRHAMLQISMGLMLVGSALCAGAVSWGMLLLGRAIQGVSSAGILNLIKIILADKVSLKENATNTTIFGWVAGLGYSVGPIIGGYLTAANWRYCFVLPIPIAALAMGAIYFLLRDELVGPIETGEQSRRKSFLAKIAIIDYAGLLIFLFGVGLLILGTSWGGATYPWKSPAVIAPVAIGGVLFAFFFLFEYLMEPGRVMANIFSSQKAMVPTELFKKRDFGFLVFVNFATGAAMYSLFYFVGIYFVVVKLYPSDKAGVQLLYYIPGIAAGVQFAILFSNFWPRQTFISLWFGSLLEAVGLGTMTWALKTERVSIIAGMMGLSGAGTGLRLMPATLHVAGLWPRRLASAMSLQDFANPFGGTLALAIMGSVFNNKMGTVAGSPGFGTSASGHMSFGGSSGAGANGLEAITRLPPDQQREVQDRAKNAVVWAFISIMPILGLAVLCASMLGNVRITRKKQSAPGSGRDHEGDKTAENNAPKVNEEEITERPFLWELLHGREGFGKRKRHIVTGQV